MASQPATGFLNTRGHIQSSIGFSNKYGAHLLVKAAPGRDLILFHPANNAVKELRGCIASVTTVLQPGIGTASRMAFNKLMATVVPAMGNEQIFFNNIYEKFIMTLSIPGKLLLSRACLRFVH